jgi:hypothetical protein
MLLKGNPKFCTKHIHSLWKAKIPDLKTLEECIPESLLVAFDIEGFAHDINEVGFAIIHNKSQVPFLPLDGNLGTFYSKNEVQAHTIEIREKGARKSYKRKKFGTSVTVGAADVGATLVQMLSGLDPKGTRKLILVGFDMNTEFEWISKKCPELSSLFTAWVDIQEIVEERSPCEFRASLVDVVNSLNFTGTGGMKGKSPHRAANDTVRFLAILSGLISLDSFVICKIPKVALLTHLPRPNSRYPFTARVTAADEEKLPLEFNTPGSLSKVFAKYDPKAVAMNSGGFCKLGGVRV